MRQLVSDSIQNLISAALTASNYFWELNDTAYTYKQIITWNQLQAAISEVEGGGTGTTAYEPDALQFTIGKTSGAPANGDSVVYHADLESTPGFPLARSRIKHDKAALQLHRDKRSNRIS